MRRWPSHLDPWSPMHIGAVADDFTGATDLATTLQARGMRAAVVVGHHPAAVVDEAPRLDAGDPHRSHRRALHGVDVERGEPDHPVMPTSPRTRSTRASP